MRKRKLIIINILFTAFVLNKLKAQTNNTTLDKLSGTTWAWTNGTDSLKIYLKRGSFILPDTKMKPFVCLIGFHYFKKGNTIIESSYSYLNTLGNDFKNSIILNNIEGSADNNLRGSITHISKDKSLDVTFTINSMGNQAFLSMRNSQGIKIEPYDSSISLPNNITLTKVPTEETRPTRPKS